MELEQLHETGSSQAELRTAAEEGIAKLSDKVSQLEDVVRKKKALFEEARGERRAGAGGTVFSVGLRCIFVSRRRLLTTEVRVGLLCWVEVCRALDKSLQQSCETLKVVRAQPVCAGRVQFSDIARKRLRGERAKKQDICPLVAGTTLRTSKLWHSSAGLGNRRSAEVVENHQD